jgi:hypothetical protein
MQQPVRLDPAKRSVAMATDFTSQSINLLVCERYTSVTTFLHLYEFGSKLIAGRRQRLSVDINVTYLSLLWTGVAQQVLRLATDWMVRG